MKILQANINHCRLAHDMLLVSATEKIADLVVVAEPYTIPDNWFSDTTGRAAIFITNTGLDKCKQTTIVGCGIGYVGISFNGLGIISVYVSPNANPQEVEVQFSALEALVRDLQSSHSKILMLGDFNAKSPLWGADRWCGRGKVLFQLATSLGLHPTIAVGGATCERGGGSVVDIMLGNDLALSPHISSEERLVAALIKKYGDESFDRRGRTGTTHEVDKFIEDLERLVNGYTTYRRATLRAHKPAYWWNDAVAVKRKEVNKARRKYTRARAKNVTADTEAAYAIYKAAKKALNREVNKAKKTNWRELLSEIDKDIWGRPYKTVMKKLKGKTTKPDVMCPEEVEAVVEKLFILKPPDGQLPVNKGLEINSVETAGVGYLHDSSYLPAGESGRRLPEIGEEGEEVGGDREGGVAEEISTHSYAHTYIHTHAHVHTHPQSHSPVYLPAPSSETGSGIERDSRGQNFSEGPQTTSEVDKVTPGEVYLLAKRLSAKKAPGPDKISSAVTKKFAMGASRWLAHIFTTCFRRGYWPIAWKTGRLVLLPKGKAQNKGERAYRPLSIIPCLAKLLEKVVKRRIIDELAKNDLADNQYGFRRGRSTLDAMAELRSHWEAARKEGRHCLLVLLDVKNAFNTVRWRSIIRCMEERGFSHTLIALMQSYLEERWIVFDSKEGLLRFQVFGGVPQGSVIGPILWNLVYDGLPRLRLRRDVYHIEYADDIGIVVIEEDFDRMIRVVELTIEDMSRWYEAEGLSLAHHKTEAILLTGCTLKRPVAKP
ncbi:uncharacterized protein LOC117611475 [Osmia lignaria lignaria]|uniref:uncharacterized protein LOC117611475 n=1 Tax=Osmia lignaria lignaria TaxID=1437193 RepID=UPI00402B5634